MGIKRKGKRPTGPRLDVGPPLEWIAKKVKEATKLRTLKGISVNGTAFAGYSSSYIKSLQRGGEGTSPDLWVKGKMVASVGIKKRSYAHPHPYVIIGPSSGRGRKYKFAKGKVSWAGGTRKLDFAELGYVHQFGSSDGRVPARPWLGLTTEEEQKLGQKLQKKAPQWIIFRAGGGRIGVDTKPVKPTA